MPLTQVAGIRLVVDLKQIAAFSIPQMCIRQAGILSSRWNQFRVIMNTATTKWLDFTASFMLMSQHKTMDTVVMAILLIMLPIMRLVLIMRAERTTYMVCSARIN